MNPNGHPITRLALRQYKSVESCDIDLGRISILVGRNGVGKSNVIDSLRFVADALRNTLEYSIRERGGIDQVRRKSLGGRPTHPAVAVEMQLPNGKRARYAFTIAAVQGRGFRVDEELCEVFSTSDIVEHAFRVQHGKVIRWSAQSTEPATTEDRLYLVAVSGLPQFRGVYDILAKMTFHNLNPEAMKYPQRPEPGELLVHDGRNLASVIKQIQSVSPDSLDRVKSFIQAIGVPITQIKHKQAGALETIEVAQEIEVPTGKRDSYFDAISLSDGTIRALGILVSLVSAKGAGTTGPSLIGIEEPETALHPAAAATLMEALAEGAANTQLIVTCHSPDLLDHPSVTPEMIRPVLLEKGRTVLGNLSTSKAELLKKHLSTAGELLRLDQLEPDQEEIQRKSETQETLWASSQ